MLPNCIVDWTNIQISGSSLLYTSWVARPPNSSPLTHFSGYSFIVLNEHSSTAFRCTLAEPHPRPPGPRLCRMKSYILWCKRLSIWSINTKVRDDFKREIPFFFLCFKLSLTFVFILQFDNLFD